MPRRVTASTQDDRNDGLVCTQQIAHMNGDETLAFATRLMERVWMRLDSGEVSDFYLPDVRGHHQSLRGSVDLRYADVVHRLD